jgi:hypothetical protein
MAEHKTKLQGQASHSHAGSMLGNLPQETAICCNPHNSSDWKCPHYWPDGLQVHILPKCCAHKKFACLDFFTKNVTCLSAGLLRIDEVLYVSRKTVHWLVMTNCLFMSYMALLTAATKLLSDYPFWFPLAKDKHNHAPSHFISYQLSNCTLEQ